MARPQPYIARHKPPGRYEFKYAIPEALARRVARFIEPYCEIDPLAPRDGGTYTITSLYLDTRTLALHRSVLDLQPRRMKVRVRSYGTDCDGPAWAEIKRRDVDVIMKSRARLPRDGWQALLDRDAPPELENWGLGDKALSVVRDFHEQVSARDLSPVLAVRYEREAWVGRLDRAVRVTFDRGLRYCPTRDAVLPTDESAYRPTDVAESFEGNASHVVLEIKFDARFPVWLTDMVRTFDLIRGSFTKYTTSVELMLDDASAWRPGVRAALWG